MVSARRLMSSASSVWFTSRKQSSPRHGTDGNDYWENKMETKAFVPPTELAERRPLLHPRLGLLLLAQRPLRRLGLLLAVQVGELVEEQDELGHLLPGHLAVRGLVHGAHDGARQVAQLQKQLVLLAVPAVVVAPATAVALAGQHPAGHTPGA